jgi:hypothetical protein
MDERRPDGGTEGNCSPGMEFIETARRTKRRDELEAAIAVVIDNEPDEHRWIDLVFELRGERTGAYQLLHRHHNLTGLDPEMVAATDAITREWNLQIQVARTGASGHEYRTLTHHSGDAADHRALAETILDRVYGHDVTALDAIDHRPDRNS